MKTLVLSVTTVKSGDKGKKEIEKKYINES